MKFGVHTSIAGGIDQAVIRAAELDCNTFQIFSTNPRGWKARELTNEEVEKFKDNLKQYQIESAVIHTPYLINLASPKDELYQKSIDALVAGVKRADRLGIEYLVLHPGSHTGSGAEAGITRITEALEEVLERTDPEVRILLENVAGAGTALGSSLEELKQMIEPITNNDRLGLCYDTCHGFAAGYDLRVEEELDKLVRQIDQLFGLDKLGVIHANDSKTEFASNKDRHQHIGQGEIGLEGFENLVNHPQLRNKLFILETPIDDNGDDQQNLATLKELVK
ncbi:deoxyribonuclease IV [Natroniella sulfidigena]|uniref:deoxyribonuclease IV n=1 Tax=Natroniella sulfidigena TaxID=723921 RepID=UPI00200A89EE|nr:deoxyribonuclease IV [Natroniella sulfidigena]MCK8816476.1 deoxyribonuclease IV [Natroniella sulfidigena]